MRFTLFTCATSLLASTQAATIQFNVLSPGSSSVQVQVNDKLFDLKAATANVPFYTGSADVGSAKTYKYVSNIKVEKFNRDLPKGTNSTYNDFFNRPITYANIPTLPRPLDNGREWIRADQDPDLFDTNFIPSIFVHGEPEEMNKLIRNVPKQFYTVGLTFVGKNYVKSFKNVTLSISGAGKKRNPAKQNWRWTLSPGDYINNRNNFKIRHMEEDPTQMREKLYADCLRAMGTYANQANMIRYYINGQSFGTFNMLDDVKYYSYIRANFYNAHPPKQMGPLYDGSTGAGFQYIEDPYDYAAFQPNPVSPEDSEAIYPLAKTFHNLNVKDNSAVNRFQEMFDIDQFLRFMVMEYLAGHWDGYWMMQTNDGAYKDYANNNTWYYLGQDYDSTFGVNLAQDVLKFSYKDYPAKYPDAVLINGFLENKDLCSRFESYIKDTVKTLFNNETLGQHIMAYRELIAPDLEWDRSITQKSPGINYGWNFENTYDNLFEPVSSPNRNGGGAQYGLTEWIAKKSSVVAKDLNFSL